MSKAVEKLRAEIIAQADALGDAGWMEIDVDPAIRSSGKLRVPRPPFELWAVAQSNGSHLVAPWNTVSPVGVKQGADDPHHTDWMLGAGLDPQDMRPTGGNPHHEALNSAAYSARGAIQERLLGFKAMVLLQGPHVKGRVHVPKSFDDLPDGRDEDGLPPISILKNAGPDWLEVAVETLAYGGAVIVERGGGMAHLVVELRESARGPIMRVENARKLYPDGSVLDVDPSIGQVRLVDDDRLYAEAAQRARSAQPWIDDEPAEEARVADEPIVTATEEARERTPVEIDDILNFKPRFGITRHKKGTTDPTDRFGNMEPSAKVTGVKYDVYASMHYNRAAHQPYVYDGQAALLQLMAYPRPHGDGPTLYFFPEIRSWKRGEARQACTDVLMLVEPETFIAARQARQDEIDRKERERQEAKANWAAMPIGEFIGFVEGLGRDEMALHEEYADGCDGVSTAILTPAEYWPHAQQYREAFSIIEEIVAERGDQIDVTELRPLEQMWIREAKQREEHAQSFEEFMRSTPPENKPQTPR